MTPKLKILHLEDLQSDSELITMQLNKANMQFENLVVDTKTEFISALTHFNPDIVLADHSLNSFNSMEALKIVNEGNKNIPFLLVTTAVSEELVDNIMKEGAKGYILKDNLDSLPDAIKKALDKIFFDGEGYPEIEVIPEEKLYDLRMLEEMDDNEYLAEILSIFLDETPKELKEMKMAAASKRTSVVSNKAHKLKSSSGLLEANRLSKVLMQIEITSKSENNGNELIRLVDEAEGEYKKIESLLQAHLKTIS
ncbi:MAG: response regulator [Ginsengibacter sp.]